ncbi:Ldh family oxidoreductase [Sphaerobacter sp.]|uniref:Ldh family oxidoreductase n=1 Tax=Sphaerobacter sp. TaxID=2099654 RepID=UPI001D2143AB|nr:Ldh family oxidoreductase [Sphaerobacter sp.]MBX5443931.1 Ldh family oxidoreductase [Sphaerobacter sp.]
MTTVWCAAEPLETFVRETCCALGTPEDIAAEVAHHLVRANLSGHDSHGVLRLPWYASQIKNGELIPQARPTIVRETAGTALFDSGFGFGHYATRVVLDWTLARAKQQGVASAAIRNFTHIGRLGEYAEHGAEQGLVTLVTIGTAGPDNGWVAPFGGRGRFLGTNPWAIGVPAAGRLPMVYDAATSTIAEGKVRQAQAKGLPLPPGSILDQHGAPSDVPGDLYDGGMLLPLGGSVAGHKGYGFALAAALLGGLAMSADGARDPDDPAMQNISGVLVLVLDPAAFGSAAHFAERAGAVLDAATRVEPVPGVERVLVPGEPEAQARSERHRSGIPIPEPVWRELEQLAAQFAVELPEHRVE